MKSLRDQILITPINYMIHPTLGTHQLEDQSTGESNSHQHCLGLPGDLPESTSDFLLLCFE